MKLPRDAMNTMFMHIMDYLLESKKISVDRAGHICWTYSPDAVDFYKQNESMGFVNEKLKGCLFFEDEKTLKSYTDLKNSSNLLAQHVFAAVNEAAAVLDENNFSGELIPKRLVPKKYNKIYDSCNLWRYNLGSHGNLLYKVFSDEDKRVIVLADWLSNKDYDRLF